ncbi:MAG: TonB-dependent receptor, partial [Bacteroidetes bacterium]|nr:TonB-dependent receptor [Bacteroidota bacterium]
NLASYQFLAYLKAPVSMQNYNINNSLRLSYRVLPGLNISVNAGYNRNMTDERSANPAAAQNPASPYRTATFASGTLQTLIVEPQADYTYTAGKAQLNVLVGGTYKKNLSNSTNLSAGGYANDNFMGSVNGATYVGATDNSDIYKYSAGFGRIRMIYDQKYILSLSGRRDGSSNFGPGNQFGNFGSAGLGWIFSEEPVVKNALPFLSYAKLATNYGTSGSDGVQSYQYQAFWQQQQSYLPAFQGIQPAAPLNLYNPDYSWALKKSLNASIDLGFFHDRLLLNATYYRSREGNQLGAFPLPGQVGINTVTENLPAEVQNKGWEFTLNSTNIKTSKFSWTSNFNISFNRNKLLSFPNLETSGYKNMYVIGQPVSMIQVYRFKGLNDTTGLFEYYTKDGKVTNTPRSGMAFTGGDQAPLVNREVKYMGGLGNTLNYKGFSLYFFIQFSSQIAPSWLVSLYSTYPPGTALTNVPVEALDYWKKKGDHTTLQKITTNRYSATGSAAGYIAQSSGGYVTDTYARLKTLSVSYKIPDPVLKKMHLRDLRIYANAQNLFTVTNYKVGDPEQFGDLAALPLQRTIVFGLNFNF